MKKLVYLGLGSNEGDRESALRTAVRQLERPDFTIRRISSVYETEPIGYLNQGAFLNAVLEAETTIFPMRLLLRIANIEREMGRLRTVKNGPRIIDIDILLFGKFIIETEKLRVPHPRMTERRFVLEPLVELAPELIHPVTRKKMRDYLPACAGQVARRTDFRLDVPVS